jgi:hypothetical protein
MLGMSNAKLVCSQVRTANAMATSTPIASRCFMEHFAHGESYASDGQKGHVRCYLQAELGGLLSDELDLLLAVSLLVVFRTFVDVLLTMLQHLPLAKMLSGALSPPALPERLAIGTGHRQTRDGHSLASKGIPAVLEVEESPSGRTTLRPQVSRRAIIEHHAIALSC